jgi:hypothetical protein
MQVVGRPDGDKIATWSLDQGVYASIKAAGASHWGDPQLLSQTSRDESVQDIAVASSGRSVIVWQDDTSLGVYDRPLRWALLKPGARRFGAERTMPGVRDPASFIPQVVATPSGAFVAVWEGVRMQGQQRFSSAWASTLHSAGEHWSTPQLLSRGKSLATPEALQVAPDGTVFDVWTDPTGLFVSRLVPGARRWREPIRISPRGGTPTIGIGTDGTVAVAWSSNGVYAVVESPGASHFSMPVRLWKPHTDAFEDSVSLAVGADGRATAIWTELVGSHRTVVTALQPGEIGGTSYLATRPAGAVRWTKAIRFRPAGGSTSGVSLAWTSGGTLVAGWFRPNPIAGSTDWLVESASRRASSHKWSARALIADRASRPSAFSLTATASSILANWSDRRLVTATQTGR